MPSGQLNGRLVNTSNSRQVLVYLRRLRDSEEGLPANKTGTRTIGGDLVGVETHTTKVFS